MGGFGLGHAKYFRAWWASQPRHSSEGAGSTVIGYSAAKNQTTQPFSGDFDVQINTQAPDYVAAFAV